MWTPKLSLVTSSPLILILSVGCANGHLPVNSLIHCPEEVKKSTNLTVSHTEIIGYLGKQSEEGNPRITRNKIQNCLKEISTYQCSDFWDSFSNDVKGGKYSEVEYYFIRSGAGGVLNEKEVDAFFASNLKDPAEPSKTPDLCPKPDQVPKFKSSSKIENGSATQNLSMPPWWFHPELKITNSQIQPFPLQAIEAKKRTFPSPFLFDKKSERPPVWVYRLNEEKDKGDSFTAALTCHVEKLRKEMEFRRDQIKKKMEENQKKNILGYSMEEAVYDVSAFNNACHVEPLLALTPEVPTLKILNAWIQRLNAKEVKRADIDVLEKYWAEQKEKYKSKDDIQIATLIDNFMNLLEISK